MLLTVVALLSLGQLVAGQGRNQLAADMVGLNAAFMEGQRAGKQPSDSGTYGSVWRWKTQAFLNVCPTLTKSLSAQVKKDLVKYPGYFEAGNTVIAPGPSASGVAQQALGAIFFDKKFSGLKPSTGSSNSGCVTSAMAGVTAADHLFRHLMYSGRWLSAMILDDGPPDSFKMLTGISDGSTYDDDRPTWLSPLRYADKCYIADAQNPAGDIAAQVAAALALDSKYMRMKGSTAAASLFEKRAKAAYAYAKEMDKRNSGTAACSKSSANTNCIGDCAGARLSACELYSYTNSIDMQLFTAAGALYWATGIESYRTDADNLYQSGFQFWWQWGHSWPTGMISLAAAPDPKPPAKNSKSYYGIQLRQMVQRWTDCASGKTTNYCKKTPDGRAYPVDLPWGNMGTLTSAVCAAGIYNKLGIDDKLTKESACFIESQLGYITNHKCSRKGESCNTGTSKGFSYIVGYGNNFPTRVHSREVSYPFFSESQQDDNFPLCGGVVSGPYTKAGGFTDKYTNNRKLWVESEAALDYSGAVACAFGGYASLPASLLSGCNARSPFDGSGSPASKPASKPPSKPASKPASKPPSKPTTPARRTRSRKTRSRAPRVRIRGFRTR